MWQLENARAGTGGCLPSGWARRRKDAQKLFNEARVPPELRNQIPVLCDDSGILLVPGFGCDIRAAVDQNTRQILVVEIKKDAG